MNKYEVETVAGGRPIKSWTRGVVFEDQARQQVRKLATLPFIFRHVAVMPDVHAGKGSTVGTVIATKAAIIPAAVGVDVGCGVQAHQLSLKASDLPDDLGPLRSAMEAAVPHGRTDNGGVNDRGAWGEVPDFVRAAWAPLDAGYRAVVDRQAKLAGTRSLNQLGSLGGGNHMLSIAIDEEQNVWVLLHSGSRGVGNRIGTLYTELAKQDMRTHHINLPDQDLAYLSEGTQHFDDYWAALSWAQDYARVNREVMMGAALRAIPTVIAKPFRSTGVAVNCHHNYATREVHFGEEVFLTRKGAVRAGRDEMGVILHCMGGTSYVVRGRGNAESFETCSHGAGRVMSRTAAKKAFTVQDHEAATAGVECRKDEGVIDETPGAYKQMDSVMAAQDDLVDIVHSLKEILVIKG